MMPASPSAHSLSPPSSTSPSSSPSPSSTTTNDIRRSAPATSRSAPGSRGASPSSVGSGTGRLSINVSNAALYAPVPSSPSVGTMRHLDLAGFTANCFAPTEQSASPHDTLKNSLQRLSIASNGGCGGSGGGGVTAASPFPSSPFSPLTHSAPRSPIQNTMMSSIFSPLSPPLGGSHGNSGFDSLGEMSLTGHRHGPNSARSSMHGDYSYAPPTFSMPGSPIMPPYSSSNNCGNTNGGHGDNDNDNNNNHGNFDLLNGSKNINNINHSNSSQQKSNQNNHNSNSHNHNYNNNEDIHGGNPFHSGPPGIAGSAYYNPPQPSDAPSPDSVGERKTTLWMGDLEPWMDEEFVKQIWQTFGETVDVKVIRDRFTGVNAGYCFVDFSSTAAATKALMSLSGTYIPNSNKLFKLNWASGGGIMDKKDFAGPEFSIFVGDLGPEVHDNLLLITFQSRYASCRSAKVVTDPMTGLSRGYGFVRFAEEAEQQRSMVEMQGIFCGTRPMRISVATPKGRFGAGYSSWVIGSQPSAGGWQQANTATAASMFNDPNNTTVFVGGLTGAYVSEEELASHFASFGPIVYVKIPPGKGCGFVSFVHRPSAEQAIAQLNGTLLAGNRVRLSWGRSNASMTGMMPSMSLPWNNNNNNNNGARGAANKEMGMKQSAVGGGQYVHGAPVSPAASPEKMLMSSLSLYSP